MPFKSIEERRQYAREWYRHKNPNERKYIMKNVSDSAFAVIVENSKHWVDVAQKCGYGVKNGKQGGDFICHKRAMCMNLNTEHFTELRKEHSELKVWGCKGKMRRRGRSVLKRMLNRAGVPEICQICHCEHLINDNSGWKWNDREISLQVDHIRGRLNQESDDDIQNLRWLCPSCHSIDNTGPHSVKVGGKPKQSRLILQSSDVEYKCSMCKCAKMQLNPDGQYTWCGHVLKLQCDHIDGDRNNNDISNLRWLCPNCHATTDTYGGRNRKRKREAALVLA